MPIIKSFIPKRVVLVVKRNPKTDDEPDDWHKIMTMSFCPYAFDNYNSRDASELATARNALCSLVYRKALQKNVFISRNIFVFIIQSVQSTELKLIIYAD